MFVYFRTFQFIIGALFTFCLLKRWWRKKLKLRLSQNIDPRKRITIYIIILFLNCRGSKILCNLYNWNCILHVIFKKYIIFLRTTLANKDQWGTEKLTRQCAILDKTTTRFVIKRSFDPYMVEIVKNNVKWKSVMKKFHVERRASIARKKISVI